MKMTFRSIRSLVLLSLLIIAGSFFLTGCGFLNQAPEAIISTDPSPVDGTVKVLPGKEITFDGSSSRDPDGSIVSYKWNFGDGATKSKAKVTHSYDSEGSYQVELTVTDDGGKEDKNTVAVKVSKPEPPSPPYP